jgi:endo-1,4-beta-xylanase
VALPNLWYFRRAVAPVVLAACLLLPAAAEARRKPAQPVQPRDAATALQLAAGHERKARRYERLARKQLRKARLLKKRAARTSGKSKKRLLAKARKCRKRAKKLKRRARWHRKQAKRLRKRAASMKPKVAGAPARGASRPLGTAVTWETIESDGRLRELFLRHFDQMTPENEMKWYAVHPGILSWDFSVPDEMVNWAIANGKAVRGHTLIYTKQNPAWVDNGVWTRETLLAVMRNHIRRTMQHFQGRIHEWDVVNEAIDGNGNWQDNVWLRVIGPDYVDYAFRYAREADPGARLYYNDWGLDSANVHTNAVLSMVQGLRSRGVPIDGVGIQGHVTNRVRGSEASASETMRSIAALGLNVAVTEMDVRADDGGNLGTQAAAYRDYAKACRLQPRCTSFTTWGIVDKYSWFSQENPGWVPLPFDNGYQPKPAWGEIRDWIKGA